MVKPSIDQTLFKAKSHAKKGEIAQAQKLYQIVLQAFPKNKRAQKALTALSQPKQSTVMQSPPQDTIDQLINLYNQGQLVAVAQQAQALAKQYPAAFIVWNILGVAKKGLGKTLEASQSFEKVTELNPNFADGYNNLGVTLKEQGKLVEAIAAYSKAVVIKPDYAEAYCNMGVTLKEQGKLVEAIAAYSKALSLKPDYAEAYCNMGVTLKEQGKLVEAIAAYSKALSLKPDYAQAYNNMGNALKTQGNRAEAIAAYNQAVIIKPDYAEAYTNMGNTLKEQGKLASAIEAFDKALSLTPNHQMARAQKLHQLAHICDWDAITDDAHLIAILGTNGECVSPFGMLSLEDAPKRHHMRSEAYAKAEFSHKPVPFHAQTSRKSKRLRIGYFSADFHDHATMYLMAKVFAAHDTAQFEIFAYSYGPDRQDEMRRRLIGEVDVFRDVREMSDMQIVDIARTDTLDIAVDLKGLTRDTRLAPFAYGLAPVQISYLGYPGTLGADFIDYIVADPTLIPDPQRADYAEQIIYLPNTYQPTDNTRVISDNDITRDDMGLPRDGFVFCCFNNTYKISPAEFDIWMRLLSNVDGSVLWLLQSNQWAEQNLRQEAEKRGVSADRLVFAEKAPQSEHLARHKLADLFVDTFNYNAHTSASDALWAGLPLVTKMGQGFATRVAGSLLNAVGLSELITENEHDYEALILDLATNPAKLSQVKETLAVNRLTQPLFDTEQYTKHLEDGYQKAYQTYSEGKQPQTIIVPS